MRAIASTPIPSIMASALQIISVVGQICKWFNLKMMEVAKSVHNVNEPQTVQVDYVPNSMDRTFVLEHVK